MNTNEHVPTRQVLVEKAPFRIEILNNLYFGLWYGDYAGRSFFVRPATSEDAANLTNRTLIPLTDLYIVVDNKRIFNGLGIHKEHVQRVCKTLMR